MVLRFPIGRRVPPVPADPAPVDVAAEAVAAERTRIAREMHDIVAHNLSVMIALADGAALTVDRDPGRARKAVEEVARTGRQALDEMRKSLMLLRAECSAGQPTDFSPEPGLADIEALLDAVRPTGLTVAYQTAGSTEGLPTGLQLAVYRLVQEATTNAVKHARMATRVTVALRRGDSDLRVIVDDDGGSGLAAAQPGHGLIGMRERVTSQHGRLTAGPTQTGWRVSAWFPLTARP